MKRRLLLAPARQKRLCALLREGVPQKTAAESIGLSARTFRSWLAAAEEPRADTALLAFVASVTRAKALARTTFVGRIIEASKTDWRACAYLLARLAPEEFGVRATEETNFQQAPPSSVSFSYEHNGERE